MQSKIIEHWNKLGKKDRTVLAAALAVLLVFFIARLALFPYLDARKKLDRSIQANEKLLKEMVVLGSEYQVLHKGMEDIQKGILRRTPDFTLFSYLEKKAGDAGLRSNIKHMNPSRTPISGAYEEASVDIKLETITLGQLVKFLSNVESPEEVVRIKKLSVKKSPDNPEYLSVLVQVVTYQQAKPETMPGRKS